MFQYFFTQKLPSLKTHFEKLDIPDELWISKWIQTLFTIVLPYDAVKRVWDCILTNGLDFIINFSIAYLKFIEQDLLKLNDIIDIINFFKKLSPQKNEEDYGDLNELDDEQENSFYFSKSEKSNLNANSNSKHYNRDEIRKSSIDENSHKFNIEEIINSAFKLNLKKSQFESLKKEYEKMSKIEINSLQRQNFRIKELFDYKITEIANNDEDETIHSVFSVNNEENLEFDSNSLKGIKKKICFEDNESLDKKIRNNVDHGSYFEEKSDFEKDAKFSKKLTFTNKLKKNEIKVYESLLDNKTNNRDVFSKKIINASEKKQQNHVLARKNLFNLDFISDITSGNLNEESNPINLNNMTNTSIDEMITNRSDKIDNSKSLRVYFINNIRSSIDSKNISSIINKLNPPILKDNTDFKSSFTDISNQIPFK